MDLLKHWNWQAKDWPQFTYDATITQDLEAKLLKGAGVLLGVWRHLDDAERGQLTIDVLTGEAMTTSAIEGEQLNRASIQSSLQRRLGLAVSRSRPSRAEEGVADLMVTVYRDFAGQLSKQTLCDWHGMVCVGRDDLKVIGDYRRHQQPMVIVSGPAHEPRIHYEAPPSARVPHDMKAFLSWFNHNSISGPGTLPPLVRASVAHLYFETIHPFEDGNGRIGRAIVAKSLAQSLDQPILLSLSEIILKDRRQYYDSLQAASKTQRINDWIRYFATVIVTAQEMAIETAEFVINKGKFLARHADQLNVRQLKVLTKMLANGPNGFTGGMSAEKYISITRTSRATATRDLNHLVSAGALSRTGTGKGTKYLVLLD